MYDEHFFMLASLVVFIVLAFKPFKKAIIDIMDKYSQGVLNSVVEAEKIRKESEAELSKMKKKSAAISVEVEKMLAEAQEESRVIMDEARERAEYILTKRTKLALQRISQQEDNIHRTIRDELVAHVLRAVETSLSTKVDQKAKQEMIASSLGHAKKLVH